MPFFTPSFIIAILIAVAVHEWAHGAMAYKLGDPTAKMEGRLTLNPLAHLDLMGTILFIFVGFGWGKPVPVNPQYFKNWKRDNALVAFAGPLSNIVVAFIAFFLMVLLGTQFSPVGRILDDIVTVNLILMAFNLLPIAPLDGSKILQMWIPLKHEEQYLEFMRRGPIVLIVLIVAGRAFNLPVLSMWIQMMMAPFLAMMGVVASLV